MNANINNINIDSISHISRKGVAIIFDSIALIISKKGIVNKNVVPKAADFLVFPMRLINTTITHKNKIEVIAITEPTENIAFTFNKLLNSNK